MAEIADILKENDIQKIIEQLCVDSIEDREVELYLGEYNNERKRRSTSVGMREDKMISIYSDTEIDKNGEPLKIGEKAVVMAKVATNTPKRIVRTAVSWMFGGKMMLSSNDSGDWFYEYKKMFENKLRMHSMIKQFTKTVMIETKAAIMFYPETLADKTSTIRAILLDSKSGEFFPHFNSRMDMDAFTRRYKDKIDGKECKIVEIRTKDIIRTIVAQNGSFTDTTVKNLSGIIDVVYAEIDSPYWEDIAVLMDAFEMRLSKLIDGNDYNGEPIQKVFGTASLSSKDTVGKELHFDIETDENGKTTHGDSEYMINNQSPEPIKLELEILQNEIDTGSATPNLSPKSFKGLGYVSASSRKLMFIEAFIKADDNLIIFQPAVERMVKVVKNMMSHVTHVKLHKKLIENDICINFGSVLPEDIAEELANLAIANGGKAINSQKTVTSRSPYTKNIEMELKAMEEENSISK